ALTSEDYARAEQRLAQHARALVTGLDVNPAWADDQLFTYRSASREGGWTFMAVEPRRRSRRRAFDHGRLAEALATALGEAVDPERIPFSAVTMTREGLRGTLRGQPWRCDLDRWVCAPDEAAGRNTVVSPDGRLAAFTRDHDLWVRDLATGEERALTTDGVQNYGWATNDAGWIRSDIPVLLWSPDSRKIATFRHDGRGVSQMYLVGTKVGAPELMQFNYPLPEDSLPFRIERTIIEVDTGRRIPLRMPPDMHRSTVCDHIWCNGVFSDVEWAADGSELYFVSSSRDHKEATLRVADAASGAVRDVLFEREETFFESGYDQVNWFVMEDRGEVVWYSRRSDWGHLYLYDLATGALKRAITEGAWNVLQVRHVDEAGRAIYFVGSGREPGDPYFEYLYRVGMDDGRITLLTPDSANHEISISPGGTWLVDQWSTPVTPPRAVVRDMEGRAVVEVEEADISRLVASGWEPPIPFTTLARDGVTELHGLMYRPKDFDPTKKYPVINYLYPGPQTGSVGSRSFSPARRDHQALAELGFVVVEVDAMGTPKRSHSFHSAYYGDMGDNGLPDQVAALRQLGERHPWMDLDRVGIWGHSGGGFASTAGILRYPDFYKVAVSQAGNHDNRNYEDDWGEKWQGLLETDADGSTSYDNQANQLLAGNLKGKLLLAHGTMDDNVPPSNTLLMVDALIAANKDFDLIMMTNRRHGFAMEPYMMRRRWDYFVKHLMGAEPPREFEFGRGRPVS
ncbi:MAG: DPP IV N-terminal domain-containing protein, partial [Longimicrobiales bacterium]|nr:DPP IV N-terminal domain-containing protein [Longimicrobiales bacterium]